MDYFLFLHFVNLFLLPVWNSYAFLIYMEPNNTKWGALGLSAAKMYPRDTRN